MWTVAHPGSSVHEILQARILEWALPPAGDLPDLEMEPVSPAPRLPGRPVRSYSEVVARSACGPAKGLGLREGTEGGGVGREGRRKALSQS